MRPAFLKTKAGMVVATLAIVALTISLSLSLALASGRSGPDKRAVILAALKSSGWKGVFPSRETKRDCWINGGGPAPGTRFEATCRTRVRLHGDGSATVLFTHWIGGGPHTWVYAVSRSLRVRFVRQFGPGPAPEYMA